MIDQPKLINVPGIPDQLREQTLAEYVMLIPDRNHLVHRELRELQRAYLELPKLQSENAALKVQVSELLKPYANPTIPEIAAVPPSAKAPCPHCGKLVNTLPGPWASHMKTKHDASDVPIPAV